MDNNESKVNMISNVCKEDVSFANIEQHIGEYMMDKNGDYFKIIGTEKVRCNTGDRNRTMARYQYRDTGYIGITKFCHINNRAIKDKYKPIVCGVGYMGDITPTLAVQKYGITKEIYDLLYRKWGDMLRRCYEVNNSHYHLYGAAGVTVDPRWHCFSNFLYDCLFVLENRELFLANPYDYHLDKDYKQQYNDVYNLPKVYSPETCIFLYRDDNTKLAVNNGKYYGVSIRPSSMNNYVCKSHNTHYGIYDDEIAAASMYDWVNIASNPNSQFLNFSDTERMSRLECLQHRVYANGHSTNRPYIVLRDPRDPWDVWQMNDPSLVAPSSLSPVVQ